MKTALAAALLAATLSCGGAVEAGDVVLLLGGNVLAGGDRVAALLQDMAAVTDILGPVEVKVLSRADASPAALAQMLRDERVGELRAVVAIVGDLAVLPGVDPSRALPQPGVLSQRTPDLGALARGLAELERTARDLGALLIVATTPLGLQGRIEVPELVDVAAWLRVRGPVLDLQAEFAALENVPLFANGIDRLDDWGHEELARILYGSVLERPELLPPRSPHEDRARRQMDTLLRWAAAAHPSFLRTARALVEEEGAPGPSPAARAREETRLAALALLEDGLSPATTQRWTQVPDGDEEVPGRAIGRRLLDLDERGALAGELLEARLVTLVEALQRGESDAWSTALGLVTEQPQRVESWLLLEAAMFVTGQRLNVRASALAAQSRFARGPVAHKRWELLLDSQPGSLAALPALCIASRPWAGLRPSGPELEAARRASSRGRRQQALSMLDRALARDHSPSAWRDERERLSEAAEAR